MRSSPSCYLLIALLLLAAGCGPRRRLPPPEAKPPPPSAPSLELGGSVVRIADPAGGWEFEARSAQVKASSVEGPYRLTPAECRYQQEGREPVLMQAARAELDKQAQQVLLQGSVRISSEGWVLEAAEVSYDLKGGKVVAPGPTKLTFTGEQMARRPRPAARRGGR